MPAFQIRYTSRFRRAFKKLPINVKKKALKAERLFQRDPFDPRLRTHKLKGKLKDYYSFSVTDSHRILFRFTKENEALFFLIGTHSIYK